MSRMLVMGAIVGIGITGGAMLGGCEKSSEPGAAEASADARCPHEIKAAQCPFCTPELIERDGFCGEHGVAEALCAQCRPYLKAAFRAEGDWCDEHKLPLSQCVIHTPELADKIKPGSGHGGEHPEDHADHDHEDHDDHDGHDH